MNQINVKNITPNDNGWNLTVAIEDFQYSVDVDKDYYEKLTGGKTKPEELVKKSFEFLLEREPKESILRKFNLKVIQTYFPEYENEIS